MNSINEAILKSLNPGSEELSTDYDSLNKNVKDSRKSERILRKNFKLSLLMNSTLELMIIKKFISLKKSLNSMPLSMPLEL